MSEDEYDVVETLDAGLVQAINEIECLEECLEPVLLDPNGLESAVARPMSGFGEYEHYPSIFDKAAALLEALASRQVFRDGNKRTAWVAAVTLLELNGVELGEVEPIHAEAVVRAAGVDHTFGVDGVASWLRVTAQQQAFASARTAQHPQIEYLVACELVAPKDGGTADILDFDKGGVIVNRLPAGFYFTTLMGINWQPGDVGEEHVASWTLEHDGDVPAVEFFENEERYYRFGHIPPRAEDPSRRATMTTSSAHRLVAVAEGLSWVVTHLDGVRVGALPIRVTFDPHVDMTIADFLSPAP